MSMFGRRSPWMVLALISCAALLRFGAASAASQSSAVAEGEIKFNTHCRQCHSWLKGDNRLGPSLYGVVGRKAGTAPGYLGYSGSMKNSGIVWTKDMISKWITDPYKILPDTNMRPFPGIPDAKTRELIIAFLASHHDSGAQKSPATHRGSSTRHRRSTTHHDPSQ